MTFVALRAAADLAEYLWIYLHAVYLFPTIISPKALSAFVLRILGKHTILKFLAQRRSSKHTPKACLFPMQYQA